METRQGEPAAQAQYPPEGHTFCDACEGAGWEERFGAAYASSRPADRARIDRVMMGDTMHLYAFAGVPGPDGWVAEAALRDYEDDGTGSPYRAPQTCHCGSGQLMYRITYMDTQLVERGAGDVA